MKTLACLALAGLLVFAGHLTARVEEDDGSGMKQYWLGLIYRGEAWSPEVTDEGTRIQKAHRDNIGRLVATGEMVLAGPFGDDGEMRGLFIYDVETKEHAEKLVATDPAVANGRLRVELHPWWGPTVLADLRELSKNSELHEAHGSDDDHGHGHGHEHGDGDGHDEDDHGHDEDDHGHDEDDHGHGEDDHDHDHGDGHDDR
jgi:uncharacterized protein YciI